MPTEELEQALLEAKWGSAEDDVAEVVARLLEIPREAVVRVAFALGFAKASWKGDRRLYNGEREIPEEVRTAIKAQMRRGLLRMQVRHAIRDDKLMKTKVGALIDKPADVCRGCSFSLECVAESLSTPDLCYKSSPLVRINRRADGGYSNARRDQGHIPVYPRSIQGDAVTVYCSHPRGTYVVDVEALCP